MSYAIKAELRSKAGWGGGGYTEPGWLVRAGIENQKYGLGAWTHPLRQELGYAASHVSPLVFT